MDEQHPTQEEDDGMDQWRGEVNTNLRDIMKTLQAVDVEVRQRPTRAEIELLLQRKVDVGLFESELKAMRETHASDIKDVRDDLALIRNGPAKVRDWLSVGISTAGCLGSLLVGGSSILVAILIATHAIH